ncbi:MAG: hypothetical protein WDO15_12940 [Bacteroidota bacterium]
MSSGYSNVTDFEFTAAGRMLIGTTQGVFTTTAETDLSATASTGLTNTQISSIAQSGANVYV